MYIYSILTWIQIQEAGNKKITRGSAPQVIQQGRITD
jgi:hypothetical protein